MIRYIIDIIHRIESFFQITQTGYAEHFIGGILISAFISYLIFKKTKSYWLAFLFGLIVVSSIGLFKELIDPYMRGDRSKLDLIFTCIGGLLGSSVALFIQTKREKKQLYNITNK